MSGLDYKSAGVDLDVYEESMRRVGKLVQGTTTPGVMPLPGGFAGLFRLFSEGRQYRDPVLVSGTDGVGTKIKVAQLANRFDTIGIDLVAMCVNDCLCTGALPLFFLDYVAMSHDDPQLTEALVTGIADGCKQAGMALIGGETAIMADLYSRGDFDLAGFSVGVVERDEVLTGEKVKPGDVVFGLASTGFHSNGYSLIRKVVFEHAGLTVNDDVPELKSTVGETLLKPTQIYVKSVQSVFDVPDMRPHVHAIAHITGGGLQENLARVLPDSVDARLQRNSWSVPAAMSWLQKLGGVATDEMFRVFNMGIGLVLVIDPAAADQVEQTLSGQSIECFRLGEVVAGDGQVHLS
ncbi:phosphoribosylformylglycinamidine cyclo-ligase [Rubinisphaera margarita]|uniref:phosphoribosylformylglycinamidine cyclo-ligase n=1 Tax=Rubinisphaera margarita TaxID=2909586 RepID=UPI001EE9984E|nr:phosphoribosylformylglycinamidine cyclo-ligase [Rubinisphaera margarita]MCG6155950.1 phosphoribosylformylglycinamidine cyclo-ligase [Rubinisphaera margarita]